MVHRKGGRPSRASFNPDLIAQTIIEMLLNGWAWVMLALGLRAIAKRS
jgi:hypothetical protein